jgi:hypothetical protein
MVCVYHSVVMGEYKAVGLSAVIFAEAEHTGMRPVNNVPDLSVFEMNA